MNVRMRLGTSMLEIYTHFAMALSPSKVEKAREAIDFLSSLSVPSSSRGVCSRLVQNESSTRLDQSMHRQQLSGDESREKSK